MNLMALAFLVLCFLGMGLGTIRPDLGVWAVGVLALFVAMSLQYSENLKKKGERKVPRVRVVSVQESREAS